MSIELRDGSRIEIRPIEPDDRTALAEGFERLSPESRYRRFFTPVSQLSEAQLDYFTDVDHHDHEALVAVEEETGAGVAVARYVRIGPDVAEPAIVVADDWQGRGVGTRLIEALTDRAVAEGIHRFEAPVLAYNADAIGLFERLGATRRERHGREVELSVDLHAPQVRAGIAPVLKQFATGAAELLLPRRRLARTEAPRNVIVVGTDGSEHAAVAVAAAGELARAGGARVEVVGVEPLLLGSHAEIADAVSAASADLRASGLQVHEQVGRGDAASQLARVAAESRARLIVVGAGEHSKLARRLLGGTADLVAEQAPCNVLIVRTRVPAVS